MKKIILLTSLFLLFQSCSRPLYKGYGMLEKKILFSHPQYANGMLVFEMDPYSIYFDLKDFENELSAVNYKMPIAYKDSLHITQTEDKIIINNEIRLYPINSIEIDQALDKLFKEEKFCIREKNKAFKRTIEYFHWRPQRQGKIFSKWIIGNKVIKKHTFEFVE